MHCYAILEKTLEKEKIMEKTLEKTLEKEKILERTLEKEKVLEKSILEKMMEKGKVLEKLIPEKTLEKGRIPGKPIPEKTLEKVLEKSSQKTMEKVGISEGARASLKPRKERGLATKVPSRASLAEEKGKTLHGIRAKMLTGAKARVVSFIPNMLLITGSLRLSVEWITPIPMMMMILILISMTVSLRLAIHAT